MAFAAKAWESKGKLSDETLLNMTYNFSLKRIAVLVDILSLWILVDDERFTFLYETHY